MSEELEILKRALRRAERSGNAKTAFLAQASHDLRQPMQAMFIFIENLREEGLNFEQKKLLDKIQFSAENLKHLMDNLLDVSELELGGVKPEFKMINLRNSLKGLTEEFAAVAQEKGIKFKVIIPHYQVCTDAVLLERMLRNLLSNAFKYTKNKVLFGVRMSGDKIKLMVADNGVGIKPEEAAQIFDEFYRGNNNTSQTKGNGLGLSIVKKIAKVLGTYVTVKSEPNKGSCFMFNLSKFSGCN